MLFLTIIRKVKSVKLQSLYRFSSSLVASATLFAACVAPVLAEDTPDFCAGVQQLIAQTSLSAKVVEHSNYDSFVKSKATTSPLVVQQYFSRSLAGDPALATVVSCKMKTAERINEAQLGSGDSAPVAGADQSCDAVHRDMLAAALGRIDPADLALQQDNVVVDEEALTFMGPMWLKPWPFEPLSRDESGRLHIKSKALYVPFAWWIPMPDRFKGTYYCHLIAPAFLEAVLRGEVHPGV
jgi:hypothetical protein